MLFRAAPQRHRSFSKIEALVFKYLNHYELLSSRAGFSSRFIPEQHDLCIEHDNKRISINHELRRYPPVNFKIDEQLDSEICAIADTQRKVLGLNDCGAIELITALTLRGINVIFLDFLCTDVFGLSICDNVHGCFIFVNSNDKITIERQLFTVAHEYAHLILHRPLFSREIHAPMSVQYRELLDKMADMFAGRLLCPPDIVFSYAKYYSATESTLKSITPVTVRLKKKLHVSFQSMLIALRNYGLLSNAVVSEYFRWAKSTNAITTEPWALKDDQNLLGQFEIAKEAHIMEILHKLFIKDAVSVNDVMCLLDCNVEKATAVLENFDYELKDLHEIF